MLLLQFSKKCRQNWLNWSVLQLLFVGSHSQVNKCWLFLVWLLTMAFTRTLFVCFVCLKNHRESHLHFVHSLLIKPPFTQHFSVHIWLFPYLLWAIVGNQESLAFNHRNPLKEAAYIMELCHYGSFLLCQLPTQLLLMPSFIVEGTLAFWLWLDHSDMK